MNATRRYPAVTQKNNTAKNVQIVILLVLLVAACTLAFTQLQRDTLAAQTAAADAEAAMEEALAARDAALQQVDPLQTANV